MNDRQHIEVFVSLFPLKFASLYLERHTLQHTSPLQHTSRTLTEKQS